MIVDSSAIIAILFHEDARESLMLKMHDAPTRGVGTPTLLEAGMVLTSQLQGNAVGTLARFIMELNIEAVPFDERHWKVALDAFARFGKGRHRAALNFGDCLTYAVAKIAEQPLLYLGDDFSLTDIEIA